MCGIYLTNKNFDKTYVLSKLKHMKHRGPDNLGYTKIDDITLGHLRLSILDLETRSNQPFIFDGLYLTYNGEIYNYQEIKDKLSNLGYQFKTTSDTEVLIKSYHYWGKKMLNKINGMFAFSIYDSKKNIVFSARDRLGVKPFYYSFNNGKFEISSQLSSIETNNSKICNQSVSMYLKLGYIPSPYSIYNNIKKLQPGSFMVIDIKKKELLINKYWDLENTKIKKLSYKDALTQLESLIEDCVKIRLNTDVNLGTFLSSGIDSALITSIASKISKNPIYTFTIGFQDPEYDESKIAKKYSEILKTNHKEYICDFKKLVDIIPIIPDVYDEPFSDPSSIPSIFVNSVAKKNVTVVLSGDGGDESFFGYNHFFISKWIFILFRIPYLIRKRLLNYFPTYYLSLLFKKEKNTIKEILIIKNLKDYLKRIFISNLSYLNSKNESWFEHYRPYLDFSNNIYQKIADLNIKLWLENNSNVKVDRASMYNSIEVRSPFLDYRIIEFARSLPFKYRHLSRNRKRLLKDILKKYIPENLFDIQKKGFSIPLKKWTRKELKPELQSKLTNENLQKIPGLKVENFKILMSKHFEGQIDFSLSIWRVYLFILWLEKNYR